jgi:hypothetical protein
MERQKFWEFKRRSRRDEPFIITIGVKWKCSNVCSWGILTDREIWTLFLRDLINSIRHSPSIFIIQLFDNMKKPKALPSLSIGWRAEAFGAPSNQELGPHNHSLANMFFSHAFVHGSIFWCPRRRGTTPIHSEFGGETLLRWRYCRGSPAEK